MRSTRPVRPSRWAWLRALLGLSGLVGCGEGAGVGGAAKRPNAAAAQRALAGLRAGVQVSVVPPGQVAVVSPGAKTAAATLPPIATVPLVVDPTPNERTVVAEVFASPETSGTGADGRLVAVANQFNAAWQTVANGKAARIAVRRISSGTGYEFIASGKYRPAGFSPSTAVWADMARAQGTELAVVTDRLVGNVAGVVMKGAVAERLKAGRPELTIADVVDATIPRAARTRLYQPRRLGHRAQSAVDRTPDLRPGRRGGHAHPGGGQRLGAIPEARALHRDEHAATARLGGAGSVARCRRPGILAIRTDPQPAIGPCVHPIRSASRPSALCRRPREPREARGVGPVRRLAQS